MDAEENRKNIPLRSGIDFLWLNICLLSLIFMLQTLSYFIWCMMNAILEEEMYDNFVMKTWWNISVYLFELTWFSFFILIPCTRISQHAVFIASKRCLSTRHTVLHYFFICDTDLWWEGGGIYIISCWGKSHWLQGVCYWILWEPSTPYHATNKISQI